MSTPTTATASPSFLVHAEPGDGTSYDLCVFRRSGGGWAVAWESKGLVGRLRGSRSVELIEATSTGWTRHDLATVAGILNAAFVVSGNDLARRVGAP
jgi:hypothetical protein